MIILEKRERVIVIYLLVLVLILACSIRFAISAETNPEAMLFDKNSVSTWGGDNIFNFERMKIEDINNAWTNANKDDKLKFLNSYVNSVNSEYGNPRNLQLEGLDDKNLKFSKSGGILSFGDSSSNIDLQSLPKSLKGISYTPTTSQEAKSTSLTEGANKFTLNFGDGSKVSFQQGQLNDLFLKDTGQFAGYNKLAFKDNNGNQANLFTNGKYSDMEINKDGKITFMGNSAVQTSYGSDLRSTTSKPIGPTQDASVKMIDRNHIQVSKASTETWRGTIRGSFDPTVTDIFLTDQKTDSKQFVQIGDNQLSMAGKDISFDVSDKFPLGKELQKITGDGNGLSANLYGVPVTFNGEKTSVPSIVASKLPFDEIYNQPVRLTSTNGAIGASRNIEILNNQDNNHAYQLNVVGITSNKVITYYADSIGTVRYGGSGKYFTYTFLPLWQFDKSQPDYINNFKYPQSIKNINYVRINEIQGQSH